MQNHHTTEWTENMNRIKKPLWFVHHVFYLRVTTGKVIQRMQVQLVRVSVYIRTSIKEQEISYVHDKGIQYNMYDDKISVMIGMPYTSIGIRVIAAAPVHPGGLPSVTEGCAIVLVEVCISPNESVRTSVTKLPRPLSVGNAVTFNLYVPPPSIGL